MAGGGNIGVLPAEFFGRAGAAQMLQRLTQQMLQAAQLARQNKREDEADELMRRRADYEEAATLMNLGAPRDYVTTLLGERGRLPEGVALQRTSAEIAEQMRVGAYDKFLQGQELTPWEQTLMNAELTGDAGLTPEQRLTLGQLGMTGAELDIEAQQGNIAHTSLVNAKLEREEADYVTATEAARLFLTNEGRPDLASAGIFGLDLWERETGNRYTNAQIDNIRQNIRVAQAQLEAAQNEVRFPPDIRRALDEYAKISPTFVAANAADLASYIVGVIPEGATKEWVEAADALIQRSENLTYANAEAEMLDLIERGDPLYYQFAQLEALKTLDPRMYEDIAKSGAMEGMTLELLQRIPGFEAISLRDGWLGSRRADIPEGTQYMGPGNDLFGLYERMRADGRVPDVSYVNEETVQEGVRATLQQFEGDREAAKRHIAGVLADEHDANDRAFFEAILETLEGGEPRLLPAPPPGSSLVDMLNSTVGATPRDFTFPDVQEYRNRLQPMPADATRVAPPVGGPSAQLQQLQSYALGGNFSQARTRWMQLKLHSGRHSFPPDLPSTEVELLRWMSDSYMTQRTSLLEQLNAVGAQRNAQRTSLEAQLRRLDQGYTDALAQEIQTSRTRQNLESLEGVVRELDALISAAPEGDPRIGVWTQQRDTAQRSIGRQR